MKIILSYMDTNGEEVSSTYTEKDLREWLDNWPDYAQPDMIRLERVYE